MRLSYHWLQEYVTLPASVTPEKLAHDLTMATVEVEEVVDQARDFQNMVVGKIVALKEHPHADRLQLAVVDVGEKGQKQIVCGGTNLFEGMLVAVALPGARVRWHGEGDMAELTATTIRGEESYGMICASAEIGLGDIFPCGEREIMNISFTKTEPGVSLAAALKMTDVVLVIDNKSLTNRPDLWSHYGMARELSAIYKVPLKELELIKLDKGKSKRLKISVKSKACRRYMGVVVDKVKISPSPDWMQQRLIAAGMRPINNIVDLTNYVMLETGEPMHAFDYKNISGAHIVVRQANDNETLTTLEGEERKLSADTLVIADAKRPIALAGIKGGADAGISESTATIVIESANFDPVNIRKTSLKYNVRTDASQRHEKALDIERPEIGLARFLALLNNIVPDANVDSVIDEGEKQTKKVEIDINREFIVSRLGRDIPVKEISETLERLGFSVKVKDDNFRIAVPPWRATGDVSIPEDIVEEVARIYGYDNLGFQPLRVALEKAVYQPRQLAERRVKEYLSMAAGMNEVFCYPWVADRFHALLGSGPIALAHPPAEDRKFLATTLIPNIIEAVEKNIRNIDDFRLFELAKVFIPARRTDGKGSEYLPDQPTRLAGAVIGPDQQDTFLAVKGIVQGLLSHIGVASVSFIRGKELFAQQRAGDAGGECPPAWLDLCHGLALHSSARVLGYMGFVSEEHLAEKCDFVNKSVCFFELFFDRILKTEAAVKKYEPVPPFPPVIRDLSIVVDRSVAWEDIRNLVFGADNLVASVSFLSPYDLGSKKSIALRVEYRSPQRTLTGDEVEKIEQKILRKIKKELGGELRT